MTASNVGAQTQAWQAKWVVFKIPGFVLACENIRFSSLFAAGDVSCETSPAEKSVEKRMFFAG